MAATGDGSAAGPPPRWHSALFVVSFVLALAALANLADLLGSDGLDASGTVVWVGTLLMGLMAWLSIRFDSAAFAAFGPQRGQHHAVGYVNAAGVAVLAIATLFGLGGIGLLLLGAGGGTGLDTGTGWELVILAGGFALIAYSAWTRQSGPAYVGALDLLAFVLLAGGPGENGPSLIGWPIVMLVVSAGLLIMGMRPAGGPPPARAVEEREPTQTP